MEVISVTITFIDKDNEPICTEEMYQFNQFEPVTPQEIAKGLIEMNFKSEEIKVQEIEQWLNKIRKTMKVQDSEYFISRGKQLNPENMELEEVEVAYHLWYKWQPVEKKPDYIESNMEQLSLF